MMTGGHGICHSEVSTAGVTTLPACSCGSPCPTRTATARAFHHHTPPSTDIGGATVERADNRFRPSGGCENR
jgi:quercetin 2,3-dioxygenase